MTGPLRFDQLNPARQNLIRRRLRDLQKAGASEADIETYLRDEEGLAPAPAPPAKRGTVEDVARSALGGVAGAVPNALAMVPAAASGLAGALGMDRTRDNLQGVKQGLLQAGEQASAGWNPGGSQTTAGKIAGVGGNLAASLATMGPMRGAAALGGAAAVADPDFSVGRTAQDLMGSGGVIAPTLLDRAVNNPIGRAGIEALTALGISGALRGVGKLRGKGKAPPITAPVETPAPAPSMRALPPGQYDMPGVAPVRGLLPPGRPPLGDPSVPPVGRPPTPTPDEVLARAAAQAPGPEQSGLVGLGRDPVGQLPLIAPVEGPSPRSRRVQRERMDEVALGEAAAKKAAGSARVFPKPDPAAVQRLEQVAREYKAAFSGSPIVRPRSGFAAREGVMAVGSTVAGATAGASQGDTPEERRWNALWGGILGLGAAVGLTKIQRAAAIKNAARARLDREMASIPYAGTQEGVVPGQVGLGGGDPTVGQYMNANITRPRATMREIQQLAKSLDMNALEMNAEHLRQYTPEQVMGMGQRVIEKRRTLTDLNRQIDGVADSAARQALEDRFTLELNDLMALEGSLSKGLGESARSLRTWQAVMGRVAKSQIQAGVGSEAQAMRLARAVLGDDADNPKLATEIHRIFGGRAGPIPNSAEAFARAVRGAKTATPGEMFVDIGKTAVLGPVSFMVNATSNIATVGANRLLAQPVAAGLDRLLFEVGKAAGLSGRGVFPAQRQVSSSAGGLKAFARGFGRGAEQAFGFSNAKAAFREAGGGLAGAKAAGRSVADRITSGIDPADPLASLERPHINYEASLPTWTPRLVSRGLQLMHDANYGLLDVGDRPFFRAVEEATVREMAELRAGQRYTRGTPAWASAVEDMTRRGPNGAWAETVPMEHQAAALSEAARETYKARGRLVKAATAVADIPGFNLFVKFAQTPTNIAIETTRAVPGIGMLVDMASHWNERTGLGKIAPTDRNAMLSAGRQIGVGAVAAGLGFWAYRNGFATGPYSNDPADRNARELLDQTNRKPNAFSVDGQTWHDLNVLGPLGILFNMGAASAMALEEAQGKPASDQMVSAGLFAPAQAAAQQFLDMPLMSGVKDVVDVAGGLGKEGLGEQAATTLGRAVASYIPFGAYTAATARAMDPEADRSVRGFAAPFQERLPGLRDNLPSKPNALGQIAPNPGGWKYFADPTRSREAEASPVVQLLTDIGYGVRKPTKARGESDADYQARLEVEGRYIHDRLEAALDQSGDLAQAKTRAQVEQAITDVISRLRNEVARAVAGDDLLTLKRALNAGEIPDADRAEAEALYLDALGARYRTALAAFRSPS